MRSVGPGLQPGVGHLYGLQFVVDRLVQQLQRLLDVEDFLLDLKPGTGIKPGLDRLKRSSNVLVGEFASPHCHADVHPLACNCHLTLT